MIPSPYLILHKNPVEETTPSRTEKAKMRPTNFGTVFRAAFDFYKKHLWTITALMLIPSLAEMASEIIFGESFIGYYKDWSIEAFTGFGVLVWVLLVIAEYLGYSAALKIVSDKAKNAATSFGDALAYAFNRIREAFILAIRIIIYTYSWLLIILGAILMGPTFMAGFDVDFQMPNYISSWVMVFIGAVFLILIAVLIKRLLSVTFAFPLLEISEGMLGTIFFNYFILGIVLAIIGAIYGFVVIGMIVMPLVGPSLQQGFSVESMQTFEIVINASVIPLTLFASGINAMFQYAFMLKAIEEKKTYKG